MDKIAATGDLSEVVVLCVIFRYVYYVIKRKHMGGTMKQTLLILSTVVTVVFIVSWLGTTYVLKYIEEPADTATSLASVAERVDDIDTSIVKPPRDRALNPPAERSVSVESVPVQKIYTAREIIALNIPELPSAMPYSSGVTLDSSADFDEHLSSTASIQSLHRLDQAALIRDQQHAIDAELWRQTGVTASELQTLMDVENQPVR